VDPLTAGLNHEPYARLWFLRVCGGASHVGINRLNPQINYDMALAAQEIDVSNIEPLM
jgi:hypothetical protein